MVGGLEFSRAGATSEYRRFVDNDRLPISQTTTLEEMNASVGVRVALLPRGREISRFAWVPRTVTPYVGAGAGALRYAFTQTGDFVDFVDLSVFSDTFRAEGWTPSAHVLGGVDLKLHQRWFLSLEGRYLWGAGDLGATSRASIPWIWPASAWGRASMSCSDVSPHIPDRQNRTLMRIFSRFAPRLDGREARAVQPARLLSDGVVMRLLGAFVLVVAVSAGTAAAQTPDARVGAVAGMLADAR